MDSEELNIAVANEAFAENKVYMLEKQLKQANERIKQRDEWNERLDERIDRLEEKIIFLSEIRQEAGVQDANLREKLSVANDRIKQLEEMYEGEIGENEQFLGSNLKGLLIRELNLANNRIKQLEKALEATAMIIGPPGHLEWATDDEINHAWGLYIQTKEIKP